MTFEADILLCCAGGRSGVVGDDGDRGWSDSSLQISGGQQINTVF